MFHPRPEIPDGHSSAARSREFDVNGFSISAAQWWLPQRPATDPWRSMHLLATSWPSDLTQEPFWRLGTSLSDSTSTIRDHLVIYSLLESLYSAAPRSTSPCYRVYEYYISYAPSLSIWGSLVLAVRTAALLQGSGYRGHEVKCPRGFLYAVAGHVGHGVVDAEGWIACV